MKTEDVSEVLWSAIVIWPCGSTHLVSRSLISQTIADLTTRGAPPGEIIPIDRPWVFDKPGMIWTGRKMMTFRIDMLELEIPALDVGWFLRSIRDLEVRRYQDGSLFYKLHAFSRCVVLTPEQKLVLQRALEISYEDAQELAEEDFQRMYEIRKDLGEKGVMPKVTLISKDTSKN